MRRIKTAMLLFLISILLCACPNYKGGPPYIIVVNNSEREIACQVQFLDRVELDSLFQCNKGASRIEPDSLMKLPYWGWDIGSRDAGWYDAFEGMSYIQFLIMDQDTYWKYHSEPCDTIRKYVPVLHVYRLTLEDLERMNWMVVYPPEE